MYSLVTLVMSKHFCSPVRKAVMLSLADRANKEYECISSVRDIAERTEYSERSVRGALRSLETDRLLSVDVRRDPHGRQTSNRYTVHAARLKKQLPLAGAAGGGCRSCRVPRQELQGHKNLSKEPLATNSLRELSAQAPQNVIDMQTRKIMSSDWPDYQDPFANPCEEVPASRLGPGEKRPTKKGHRSTRPTSTWSITDLVYEYELEAQFNFPMRAARNNAKALAGALGRLRTEIPDFTPELVVAMVDVFLADKRRINPDIALWRQFIASWSRTVPEARRKLTVARGDRQGTSTADATAYLLDESESVWTEEQIAAMSAKYLPLDEDGSAARAIDWSTPEEEA